MMIKEFYVTFGVQYGHGVNQERHPQEMTGNGYAVIEAPDEFTARQMAIAVFIQRWSFIYPEKPEDQYVPEGELLRISYRHTQNALTVETENERIQAVVDWLIEDMPFKREDFSPAQLESLTATASQAYKIANGLR